MSDKEKEVKADNGTDDSGVERLRNLKNMKADDVREEFPGDKLVSLDPETLKQIVDVVASKFEGQLKEANDRIEELRITLEKKDAEKHLRAKGQFADGRVKMVGPRVPKVPDHQKALVELAAKENDLKGKHLRFVNNDPNIRSLRRAQGYEPVRFKDGGEVRYMDGVLMSMPRARYLEDIDKPKKERMEFNRASIKTQFQERLRGYGIEAEGDITYDSGDEFDEDGEFVQIQSGKPAESQQ